MYWLEFRIDGYVYRAAGGKVAIAKYFVAGIKNIVAAIYTNFTTAVVDDAGMEQMDGYSSRPAGDKLYLRFTAV